MKNSTMNWDWYDNLRNSDITDKKSQLMQEIDNEIESLYKKTNTENYIITANQILKNIEAVSYIDKTQEAFSKIIDINDNIIEVNFRKTN